MGVNGLNGRPTTYQDFYQELLHIVGYHKNYIFNVTSYVTLENIAEAEKVVNTVDCQVNCKADINFILESTELISETGWASEIKMALDLASFLHPSNYTFNMSDPWSVINDYFGLVHFSSPKSPKSEIVLNPAPWTWDQLDETLHNLNFTFDGIEGGSCDLNYGLSLGLSNTLLNAPRNQTPNFKFTILMAEGFYDSGPNPLAMGEKLRNAMKSYGGDLYAIGLGPRLNINFLNSITTGNPGNHNNTFNVNTYQNIVPKINGILKKKKCAPIGCICGSTTPAPSTTPHCNRIYNPAYPLPPNYKPPNGIHDTCALDVIFVLDRSESVTETRWPYVQAFAKNVAAQMVASFKSVPGVDHARGLQFAVVPFNTVPKIACDFNDVNSLDDFNRCVDGAKYYPGLTDTYSALFLTERDLILGKDGSRGDRLYNPDLVILVTDGKYTTGTQDPVPIANTIRNNPYQKATIFGVGVTGLNGGAGKVFYDELYQIVGNNTNYVFNVSSYQNLNLTQTALNLVNKVNCRKVCAADISFVLESTELVSEAGFVKETSAMMKIVSQLGASPYPNYNPNLPNTTWAVPTNYYSLSHFSSPFASEYNKQKSAQVFPMGAWTEQQMKWKIGNLTLGFDGITGGMCDLSLGLWLGRQDFGSIPGGLPYTALRNQTPDYRFTILMGEGFQDTGLGLLADNATALRKNVTANGGQIFTVVLGPRANSSVLNWIATGDFNNASNLYNLTTAIANIPNRIHNILSTSDCAPIPPVYYCSNTTTTTTTTPPPCQLCWSPVYPGPPGPKPSTTTGCALDVVFVLDKSESVTETGWPDIQAFCSNIVDKMMADFNLPVGWNGLQFAVVTFNTHASVSCYFDQSTSAERVKNCINSVPYSPGLTATGVALSLTQKAVFNQRGDRANNANLLILVTDGAYTQGTPNPIPIANTIRNNGTKIFAVGVTGLNGDKHTPFYRELYQIVGNHSQYVFNVSSYDALKLPATAENVVEAEDCQRKCGADIVFILETTELIGYDGWNLTRNMVNSIVNQLGANPYNWPYKNGTKYTTDKNFYGIVHFSDPYSITPPSRKSGKDYSIGPWSPQQIRAKLNTMGWGGPGGVQGGHTDPSL